MLEPNAIQMKGFKNVVQGYISSEYEGSRELFRASDVVRRQQVMLRRLLAGE